MSYALLSSTRYDPFLQNLKWNNNKDGSGSPFLLLPYHLDRLRTAARIHKWADAEKALSWNAFRSECSRVVQELPEDERPVACKIRIVVTESGALTATAIPLKPFTSDPTSASFFNPDTDYHSLFGPPLRIQVDSEPTLSSVFTATKTTDHAVYDAARTRAGVPTLSSTSSSVPSDPPLPCDVLLYNSEDLITETSIYNVAFYRSKRWLTPPVSTGCLPGVLRRWLLEQGRIYEADKHTLTRENIVEGECVLLMNGVQGCQLGKITFPSPSSEGP